VPARGRRGVVHHRVVVLGSYISDPCLPGTDYEVETRGSPRPATRLSIPSARYVTRVSASRRRAPRGPPEVCPRARARDERVVAGDERIGPGGRGVTGVRTSCGCGRHTVHCRYRRRRPNVVPSTGACCHAASTETATVGCSSAVSATTTSERVGCVAVRRRMYHRSDGRRYASIFRIRTETR